MLLLRLSLNKSSNLVLSNPSCYGEQRHKYNRILHLSGSRFSLFLLLTPPEVVPYVWHFPYFVGATSTNSIMIKLQPKIYDYIMLIVRISFIPLGSFCGNLHGSSFFDVFSAFHSCSFNTLGIWCQTIVPFLIYSIIEFSIYVALILQAREEGWTSRMRESSSIEKKRSKLEKLELQKLINEPEEF
ncbi:hypothetical protein ZWY2020_057455 [Hordeum vulgare]|nr:hypothetical protein ZWY2020_057455 [Hordeum vulgare]